LICVYIGLKSYIIEAYAFQLKLVVRNEIMAYKKEVFSFLQNVW